VTSPSFQVVRVRQGQVGQRQLAVRRRQHTRTSPWNPTATSYTLSARHDGQDAICWLMLEKYFLRPGTVDRIRSSWIGDAIERYVAWLAENEYRSRNTFRRVPILVQFGDFAASRRASDIASLPVHIRSFVEASVRDHGQGCMSEQARRHVANQARNSRADPAAGPRGLQGHGAWAVNPAARGPNAGHLTYLREERRLREETIGHYVHHLRPLSNTTFGSYNPPGEGPTKHHPKRMPRSTGLQRPGNRHKFETLARTPKKSKTDNCALLFSVT